MSTSCSTLARKEIEGSRRRKRNELKKEERESNNNNNDNNNNNNNINRVKTMDNNPKRTQSVLNYTLHFCHQVNFCQNTGFFFFCLPHKTAHKLKEKNKTIQQPHTQKNIF